MGEMNDRFLGRRQPSPGGEGAPVPLPHLTSAVKTIERRLFDLVKQSAQDELPLGDFVSELALLTQNLERCYRQIADLSARRDVDFDTTATLGDLDRCCMWLYRKIHLERAFFAKLRLEARLRGLISPAAYEVYQELLDVDEQEKAVLGRDPAEIRRLLLRDDACLPPPEAQ